MSKRSQSLFFLFLLLISQFSMILIKYGPQIQIYQGKDSVSVLEEDVRDTPIRLSSNGNQKVIVSFNSSSFDGKIKENFTDYGGIINKEWNTTFSSISGFAGALPTENLSEFQSNWPEATIETDEIIEAQMNYASLQSGAVNSTWGKYGYKGDTNSSIAVLDTGINPNLKIFPKGYEFENLSGNIVGWEDFMNEGPISDDNGHGTFISSIIAGTGYEPYNSTSPSQITLFGNYSHLDISDDSTSPGNYSFKLCSFNVSKEDSRLIVNSSWNLLQSGIDGFWFQLTYNNSVVNQSYNLNTNQIYTINHSIAESGTGIYDIYAIYHKNLNEVPEFFFHLNISFYPEFYAENYSYFTGIANGSKIVSYKILNQSGLGYTSDLIDGLLSVKENRTKYHIISVCLSVGTLGNDVAMINSVIDEIIKEGILVVIAAGNSGIKTSDPLNRLAQNKNAIIVGATNDKDQIASYSSMGKTVGGDMIKPDIVAPGGSKLEGHRSIISSDAESNKSTTAYGTSISTAIVSAALNLLIEAECGTWEEWDNLNLTKWVKIIKSRMLMTASETNMDREDDPETDTKDESDYSPTTYYQTLTSGLKDIHEGYGRLNIQPAIDALSKRIQANSTINGTLISSNLNPLGTHVYARQINLTENYQYLFNLTLEDSSADFDLYLFSNASTKYGEPILLGSSRRAFGVDLNYFYFTPKSNQTECILAVKAIDGNSTFEVNISSVENAFVPEMKIPEMTYAGGQKNTTVISYQIYTGSNNPDKNYTIDSYLFFIEYYDNDTTNVPPQEIYVSIDGTRNYTLTQFDPSDDNYTDGAIYWSEAINLYKPMTYNYFFVASDGAHRITSSTFSITTELPSDTLKIPYSHQFSTKGGWTTNEPDYWDLMTQLNANDDRSREYDAIGWTNMYFGLYHDEYWSGLLDYSYQPVTPAGNYPNGSLLSPLFDLTNLSADTIPIAKFGLRVSINSGDFINLQISLNWTDWITLENYTNTEREWFMEIVNLTQYK